MPRRSGAHGSVNDDTRDDTEDDPFQDVLYRLVPALFFYIVGTAMLLQVTPKIVLDSFDNDHGKASKFNGWVTLGSSAIQFVSLPCIAAGSDVTGRRPILSAGLLIHGVIAVAIGLTAGSLAALVACQLTSGVCVVVLPMAQCVIADTQRHKSGSGLAHGFGVLSATFGLGLSVGPLLGGYLSGMYGPAVACYTAAALSAAAWATVQIFSWPETAGAGARPPALPALAEPDSSVNSSGAYTAPPSLADDEVSGVGGNGGGDDIGLLAAEANQVAPTSGPISRNLNPIRGLRLFGGSRSLAGLAFAYCCFIFAVDAWSTVYLMLSFRYDWSPVLIGAFFSVFGLLLALAQGVLIRVLVPEYVSERAGVPLGMILQCVGALAYGAAPRGWMFYVAAFATCLYVVADPCMQSIMAKQVCPRQQGVLLGALSSLRTVCQGVGGPLYGNIFSRAISPATKDSLGFLVPGAPFYLASCFSACGAVVAWYSMRGADGGRKPDKFVTLAAGESRCAEAREPLLAAVNLSNDGSGGGGDIL